MSKNILCLLYSGTWYILPEQPNQNAVGSTLATENTIRALIQYGNWDEIHFIKVGNSESFSTKAKLDYLKNYINTDNLFFITWGLFLDNYSKNIYKAIYYSYVSFHKLQYYLRHNFPNVKTIFIGQPHAINFINMQYEFLHNIIFPFKEYDALICSSSCLKILIEKIHANITTEIFKMTKKELKFKAQLPIIPFSVDPELYKPRDKKQIRKELDLSPNAIYLLTLGRISIFSKSDIYPLLVALKTIRTINPNNDIRLVIAGADIENYSQEILKKASYLGVSDFISIRVNLSDLAQRLLYSACDIFLSLSDNFGESFGLTILEAMSSGLPIVATDWNGYKDLIVQNDNGYLIPTLWSNCIDDIALQYFYGDRSLDLRMSQSLAIDIDIFINKLQLLITDKNIRNKMSIKSREIILHKYTLEHISKSFIDFINFNYNLSLTSNNNSNDEYKALQNLLSRNYFKEYCHYPSKILQDSDIIELTEYAINFKSDINIINNIIPFSIHEYINIFAIFDFIQCNNKISLSNCIVKFHNDYGLDRNEALRHIMWLLKYGIIRVCN